MSNLPLNMQRSIKSEIEKTLCPIHREHPKVTFTSNGFNVSCCCEKFRKDTINKCQQAISKAIQEQILQSFKGLK